MTEYLQANDDHLAEDENSNRGNFGKVGTESVYRIDLNTNTRSRPFETDGYGNRATGVSIPSCFLSLSVAKT